MTLLFSFSVPPFDGINIFASIMIKETPSEEIDANVLWMCALTPRCSLCGAVRNDEKPLGRTTPLKLKMMLCCLQAAVTPVLLHTIRGVKQTADGGAYVCMCWLVLLLY